VAIGNRMDAKADMPTTVVGPLCTPLDMLAERMMLPAAGQDDLVVVFQSGAYGPSASPTEFLSHPQPFAVLI
jgi:diaminopimelate decarboxylase